MSASPSERYEALLRQIRAEFPGFRLAHKRRSRLHRAIDLGLRGLTLGRMSTYLRSYQTTIGQTVYVSDDWDERPADERYVVMRHERVHLHQFRRYSTPVMAVLYLLVPLPIGAAWFRAWFEKQAYRETVLAAAAVYGPAHVRAPAFRDAILRQFTGPSYAWMWPFRRGLERWYDGVLAELDENDTPEENDGRRG